MIPGVISLHVGDNQPSGNHKMMTATSLIAIVITTHSNY
jgi:hypothetical protein